MFKDAWARLFRAKRPFKLTKPGWIFILYTIGVGAGAINTGNNLLYLVFGVFLGLILASGFLSDLSLWGVEIEYTFPHAAQAGEPVSVFVKAANTKRWLPSISAHVSMEGFLKGKPVKLTRHVPFIHPLGSESTRLEWTPSARGWFQLDHVRLTTRFPFSLLEKWWRLHRETSHDSGFFVTPTVLPLDVRHLPLRLEGDDKSSEQLERGDGAVLMGLHAYAPGDNPRRIHWKSSAKRAPLYEGDASAWLVREMNKDEREEILFVCPPASDCAAMGDAEVETWAEFLASALAACRAQGYLARIVSEERLVGDEEGFLALWDPRKAADPATAPFLGATPAASASSARKWVNVKEAVRVGHAR